MEQKVIAQNRFKSKVVIAAVIAQIISIIGLLGLWSQWGVAPEVVEQVVAAVLQLFVVFGILNNGTNPNGF